MTTNPHPLLTDPHPRGANAPAEAAALPSTVSTISKAITTRGESFSHRIGVPGNATLHSTAWPLPCQARTPHAIAEDDRQAPYTANCRMTVGGCNKGPWVTGWLTCWSTPNCCCICFIGPNRWRPCQACLLALHSTISEPQTNRHCFPVEWPSGRTDRAR